MHSEIIVSTFEPLYGKPCWNVMPGYGMNIMLEFGKPHLRIIEPHTPGNKVSSRVRKRFARRHVMLRGDWCLWIYACEWKVFARDKLIGDDTSKPRAKRAAYELDGQQLTQITVLPDFGCVFEFDLGGRLETKPYDADSDQWMLYEPSGYVLTLRADGCFSYHPADEARDAEQWQSLAIRG